MPWSPQHRETKTTIPDIEELKRSHRRFAQPKFQTRSSYSPQARIADSTPKKRRELFISSHNGPLSVVAVRIGNPDRSPVGVNR